MKTPALHQWRNFEQERLIPFSQISNSLCSNSNPYSSNMEIMPKIIHFRVLSSPFSPFSITNKYGASDKLLQLSKPQLAHLQKRHNNSPYLRVQKHRLNDIMCMKHSAECWAHGPFQVEYRFKYLLLNLLSLQTGASSLISLYHNFCIYKMEVMILIPTSQGCRNQLIHIKHLSNQLCSPFFNPHQVAFTVKNISPNRNHKSEPPVFLM